MMARSSAGWLAAALVFWVLNAALHLEFSNWIVVSYATPFGEFVPRDHTGTIAAVVCLLFGIFLAARWRKGDKRALTAGGWVLAFGVMMACMFLVTTTAVEMIHFVQYGLLACLLAAAFDRRREHWPVLTLMFLVTFLGIVDELNQYFYLTRNNSSYIDFNDFVLNQVGACAGLLAWYGFRRGPAMRPGWGALQTVTAVAYLLLGLAAVLLGISGRLRYSPETAVPPGGIDMVDGDWVIFFQREPGLLSSSIPTFTTGEYYVMGALEGFLVIMAIAGLMQAYQYLARR